MLLALLALALIAAVLAAPIAYRRAIRWRAARAQRRPMAAAEAELGLRDPGRERRAEQRARELLRSCVNDEEWGMYRDLGFIRVTGRLWRNDRASADDEPRRDDDLDDLDDDERDLDELGGGELGGGELDAGENEFGDPADG